jgi:hypothetical protein
VMVGMMVFTFFHGIVASSSSSFSSSSSYVINLLSDLVDGCISLLMQVFVAVTNVWFGWIIVSNITNVNTL